MKYRDSLVMARIWYIFFSVSFSFGMAAGVLLLYNFVANLVHFPYWPTWYGHLSVGRVFAWREFLQPVYPPEFRGIDPCGHAGLIILIYRDSGKGRPVDIKTAKGRARSAPALLSLCPKKAPAAHNAAPGKRYNLTRYFEVWEKEAWPWTVTPLTLENHHEHHAWHSHDRISNALLGLLHALVLTHFIAHAGVEYRMRNPF